MLDCEVYNMSYLKMYFVALVIFLILDYIWLGFIAKDLYQKELSHLLAKNVNFVAAIVFYVLFIAAVVFFVINPAVEKQDIMYAIIAGFAFGAITYATYDLTNLATLKDWPIKVTIIDILWGGLLTSLVSSLTYYILDVFRIL